MVVEFNGFFKGVLGKKTPSDTTLNNMKKSFAKFYKKLGYFELKGSRTFWKVTHWMPLPEPPKESDKK